jgi:predicted branched-subunit amino acid permease
LAQPEATLSKVFAAWRRFALLAAFGARLWAPGPRSGLTPNQDEVLMMVAAGEQADDRPGEQVSERMRMLVVALVALEALVLLGLTAVLLVEAIRSEHEGRASGAGLAVLALIGGVGLAFCARGVARGLSWTRGPLITWQLVQAGVAMPLATTKAWWLGVPPLAAAVVVGFLIAGRHVVPPADRN